MNNLQGKRAKRKESWKSREIITGSVQTAGNSIRITLGLAPAERLGNNIFTEEKGDIRMRKFKRTLIMLLIIGMAIFFSTSAQAAGKVKLNKTSQTLKVGETEKIKLLNNKKSVKWSVSNKKIKIVKKSKTYAQVKGVNKGTAYLKAKVGGKTYKCKIVVKSKNKGDGSRENPYSAYDWHTVNVCNMLGEYTGKVKIKLVDISYSKKFINSDEYSYNASSGEEFVCMKFKIKCVSSDGEFWCGNIINELYNSKANQRLNAKIVLSEPYGGYENITDVHLYKGGESTCISVYSIKKGNKPIIYNIYSSSDDFTWFTTKK